MGNYCSKCGCQTHHYNRERKRNECDLCGAVVNEPIQEERLSQNNGIYSPAMGCLAAGKWKEAVNLAKGLITKYPADKSLYVIILRGITKDFNDTVVDDKINRDIASDAWSKLVGLNGVTSDMVKYGKQRYERQREALKRQKFWYLVCIFGTGALSIFNAVLYGSEHYFLAVVCSLCIVGCLDFIYYAFSLNMMKGLSVTVTDYLKNPFA